MSNNERPPITNEQIGALRERYTPTPVPPCRVCGSPLTLASMGGGKAPEYSCSSASDANGKTDLEHYAQSKYTHYGTGDSQVIALLDALSAAPAAPSTTNTSGRGHCPHCGVCHTSDETCIQALQRLLLVTHRADAGSEIAVGTFDPDAAGCIRWKDGIVRGDFNPGDPFFCRTSTKKASDSPAS